MLVDSLFTQCALKCNKMCNTDDFIKCRKYTTQMLSSYGRESRNYQSNRRIVSYTTRHGTKSNLRHNHLIKMIKYTKYLI